MSELEAWRCVSRHLRLLTTLQKPAAGVDSSGRRKWDVEAYAVRAISTKRLLSHLQKKEEQRMSEELETELAVSGCTPSSR